MECVVRLRYAYWAKHFLTIFILAFFEGQDILI